MVGRNEDIEIGIVAKNEASDEIEKVAKAADELDGTDAEVEVKADDNASDELADIRDKLERLDGDEAELLLKAEAKAARADLRAVQKELINLDDEQAEVEVKADIADAKKRLGAIDSELDKLDSKTVEPKVEAPDAGGAGFDAGELFGAGAIKGLGAAGVVAFIGELFNKGIDRIKLQAKFRSQFGLVAKDAKKFSREAGDIYAAGWGDSVEQIGVALGTVNRDLVNTGRVAEGEARKIAISAGAIADVFGEDVSQVIRSAGQLLENGLAPSAEAAMDAIVQGLQNGGNAAGDFFDSIDEYSQHFAGFGLSAQDMFAIFADGLANGQRDTDKLADAIKEMRIRTVEDSDAINDAYAALGLSADEFREKIANGGEGAREAFVEILEALNSLEDPIEKNRLAIELIGTQYEDIGPQAIDILLAIQGATEDATGATQKLVEDQEKAISQIDRLWRNLEQRLTGRAEKTAGLINDIIDKAPGDADLLPDLADKALDAVNPIKLVADGIGDINEQARNVFESDLEGSLGAFVSEGERAEYVASRIAGELIEVEQASDDAADEVEALAKAEADLAEETEDAVDAARDQVDALNDQAKALLDAVDAARSSADANFALLKKTDDFNEALAENTEAIDAATEGTAAYRAIQIDTALSAAALADASTDAAIKNAEAAGENVDAAEAISLWNKSMVESAKTAKGPLRDAIIAHIATVNGITKQRATEILADIDNQSVDDAAAALDGVSESREAAITAIAHTTQADRELERITRDRTVVVRTQVRPPQQGFIPEGAVPNIGGGVTGASFTDPSELTRGGGGMNAGPITINMPPGVRPDDAFNAVERQRRRNGYT